jgi:methionyl-tRNA synthetase
LPLDYSYNVVHDSQQIFHKKTMPENIVTFLSTHQWILILAAVWTIPWKGMALWRAAGNRSVAWFVILLIVNTLGILDIVYIFAFSGKKDAPQPVEKQGAPKNEKIVLDVKTEDAKPELDEQAYES